MSSAPDVRRAWDACGGKPTVGRPSSGLRPDSGPRPAAGLRPTGGGRPTGRASLPRRGILSARRESSGQENPAHRLPYAALPKDRFLIPGVLRRFAFCNSTVFVPYCAAVNHVRAPWLAWEHGRHGMADDRGRRGLPRHGGRVPAAGTCAEHSAAHRDRATAGEPGPRCRVAAPRCGGAGPRCRVAAPRCRGVGRH